MRMRKLLVLLYTAATSPVRMAHSACSRQGLAAAAVRDANHTAWHSLRRAAEGCLQFGRGA
jgi:hypothetical protein